MVKPSCRGIKVALCGLLTPCPRILFVLALQCISIYESAIKSKSLNACLLLVQKYFFVLEMQHDVMAPNNHKKAEEFIFQEFKLPGVLIPNSLNRRYTIEEIVHSRDRRQNRQRKRDRKL